VGSGKKKMVNGGGEGRVSKGSIPRISEPEIPWPYPGGACSLHVEERDEKDLNQPVVGTDILLSMGPVVKDIGIGPARRGTSNSTTL